MVSLRGDAVGTKWSFGAGSAQGEAGTEWSFCAEGVSAPRRACARARAQRSGGFSMSDAASAMETCMICFAKRKCRLRMEGQGFVCSSDASGEACRIAHKADEG